MAEVPLELPTGRVVGKFIFEVQDNDDPGEEPQLIPVTGDVTIKSSIDNLRIFDPTLGKFITFRGPHKAIVDESGALSTPDPLTNEPMYPGISLWSNDSDKLSVKGWTYTATFNLKTVDGKTLNLQPVTFTLATGQVVDLADVVQVPATPGYGLPQAEGAALRAEAAAQVALDIKAMADAGEFEGAQGLPGNATMRVDTTVGTRVFISDGVTEVAVRSSTGARRVPDMYRNGAGSVVAGEVPTISRDGDTVVLQFTGRSETWVSGDNFAQIPPGFRPTTTIYLPNGYAGATYPATINGLGDLRFYTNGLVAGRWVWVWTTKDPWPTTLPGTPA